MTHSATKADPGLNIDEEEKEGAEQEEADEVEPDISRKATAGNLNSGSEATPTAAESFACGVGPVPPQALQTLDFNVLDYPPEELVSFVPLVMHHAGCVERYSVPENKLQKWAEGARGTYRDCPFHNWYHGFAVFQFCYYQLAISNTARKCLLSLDIFALLIAALCHDAGHPGYTNQFLIDSENDLALRYNDVSVLENHHASVACQLLRHEETQIVCGMERARQVDLRRITINAILATDMAHHQTQCIELLSRGKTSPFDVRSPEERQKFLNACIHTSDLSSQVLPWSSANRWEECISREFSNQARDEAAVEIARTPFMQGLDDMCNRGKLQRDFIDFVLIPLWDPYTKVFPGLRPCYGHLLSNRERYEYRFLNGKDKDVPAEKAEVPQSAAGKS
eukprot:gnl/TRDRNA2_/TRDRNA2_90208_c1_seq1.p1 gnl/TRDRNA2_/TRDRNA2_90208_c1~~gnl/TRDRNA2_/TRDRNA2_90208_c1_seq1.p1  ORF type:complete len:455 (-),score=76.21 gnl/TRDRNA2_/TRDRNA2_90208_c1_seq1:141-1325(-)